MSPTTLLRSLPVLLLGLVLAGCATRTAELPRYHFGDTEDYALPQDGPNTDTPAPGRR